MQGAVDPDEFYVHKPTYEQGYRSVLKRSLGAKKIKMIYSDGSMREPTRNIATSELERNQFCINDQDALMLAGYAIQIEKHYTARAGVPRPMDIEWAKDGIDGQLYIVQARPETVASMQKGTTLEQFVLKESTVPLVTGHAVGGSRPRALVEVVSAVVSAGFLGLDDMVSNHQNPSPHLNPLHWCRHLSKV